MKIGIVNDSSCLICGIDSESVMHILWSCSLAVNVLGACGKKFQKSLCSGSDFLQIVEEMSNKYDME
jgi:hypothetical protein